MGAVAVAPSDPKRVYAGTGCADASSYILGVPRWSYSVKVGVGVLISADGGDTWRISKTSPAGMFWDLLVAPDDPNVLLAATDQGIQRSVDGGDTWTAVLQSDEAPWATCLSRSTATPSVVFAGTWGKGLPGSVWKSVDGGVTWKEAASGLPGDATTRTRVEVAVAPSDASRVYAIVSGDRYQIDAARSSDGGKTWTPLDLDGKGVDFVGKQGNFAIVLSVDPKKPDVVYAGGLDSWKSSDGGATWVLQSDWTGRNRAYYFTYSVICFSSNPTVETKYPGDHTTCSFQYTFFNHANFSLIWRAVYCFILPITSLTAYFGGITINRCIWST